MAAPVFGAILAGGRAERMGGADKALLERRPGGTFIGHIVEQLRAGGLEHAVIVGGPCDEYRRLADAVVPDLRPGMGPLGGIEAALDYVSRAGTADAVLFVPCDLPDISAGEIRRLLGAFRRDPKGVKMALVRADTDRPQPLCCVVHKDMLRQVREALDAGRLAVGRLWRDCGADVVPFDDERPFYNVNNPLDLKSWRECAGSREAGERGSSKMPARVQVPEELREKVAHFFEANGMELEIVDEPPFDLRIIASGERRECSTDTLQAGGWTKCAAAWAMARKHGLPLLPLGGLLRELDIKIRECCLGCFK